MCATTQAEPGTSLIPRERIDSRVLLVRGNKVLLDADLAELYGVEVKVLNQAVRRNADRFPQDFMFQLTVSEYELLLRSQVVISKPENGLNSLDKKEILRSQIVTSKRTGSGGRRYLPYAFTEQGVAMLSSVLRSPRAVAVNIEIMRAFVRLRQLIASSAELARKLASLEKKYDEQFKVVFDAIRELMSPALPAGHDREMGFHTRIPTLRPAKKRGKIKATA